MSLQCLVNTVFPDAWKTVIFVPIPITGDTRNIDNIRPISLLPVMGKVMERLINFRIIDYLAGINLIFERQGGFSKNHSTIMTASDLIKYVFNNLHTLTSQRLSTTLITTYCWRR